MSWIQSYRPYSASRSRSRSNKRSKSPTAKKFKPKQEWNNYLTDNKYSVTKEELLKKKMQFVSKHNVLSGAYVPPPITTRKPANAKKIADASVSDDSYTDLQSDFKNPINDVTSLDLLAVSSDEEQEDDHLQRHTTSHITTPQAKHTGSRPADKIDLNKTTIINVKSLHKAIASARNTPNTPTTHSTTKSNPLAHSTPPTVSKSISKNTPKEKNSPAMKGKKSSEAASTDVILRKSSGKRVETTSREGELIEGTDADLKEMTSEIYLLLQELRQFEEMTGRPSSFNAEELEELLQPAPSPFQYPSLSPSLTSTLISPPHPDASLSPKKVLKFLVQLTCQSMTYLLEQEMSQRQLQDQLLTLTDQYQGVKKKMGQKGYGLIWEKEDSLMKRESESSLLRTAPLSTPALSSPPRALEEGGEESVFSESFRAMDMLIEETKRIGEDLHPNTLTALSPLANPQRIDRGERGSAVEAGEELKKREVEILGEIAFTGTSATDFLFLNKRASLPVSTPSTLPSTPIVSYQPPITTPPLVAPLISAADMASETFDLYLQKMKSREEEEEEESREEIEGEKDAIREKEAEEIYRRVKLGDSYEDMIDRLSVQFSSTLSKTKPPQTSLPSSEQISLSMYPNPLPPTPMSASLYPASYPVKKDKETTRAFFATRELFPRSPDPRVFDATYGSY